MPDLVPATAPVNRRVRAFHAPPGTLFDPASLAAFNPAALPSPWVDLGLCAHFKRTSGTATEPLRTGSPPLASARVRTAVEASVEIEFDAWGKVQLALTCGSQQFNLLAATPAASIATGSTASTLNVGAAASGFAPGDLVAVDVDFNGLPGPIADEAYVKAAGLALVDAQYVRRVTRNVARVASNAGGVVTLASALPAGAPTAGMKAARLAGFCDREGGSFTPEWSALFLLEGEAGDRVAFHYPRLQASGGAVEVSTQLAPPTLQTLRLAGRFRALAVTDPLDGERVLCFRAYLPPPLAAV